mgnify:CR=1 FL=1
MNSLDITLLYLLAAVLGVVGCRMLRLPPMLGYLVVGVVIGPNALALAQNSQGLRYLAEFGVVFLMFVIGLEFSLPKLRAMRRHVFGLGLSQVVLTVLITTAASLALALLLPTWWKVSWQIAVALGGIMAMSSTAIVIKMVAERLELESEHGKRVLGILLFQDLAVVPLIVMIPALSAPADELCSALLRAAAKATRPPGRRMRDIRPAVRRAGTPSCPRSDPRATSGSRNASRSRPRTAGSPCCPIPARTGAPSSKRSAVPNVSRNSPSATRSSGRPTSTRSTHA